jgi:hypothetical protein
MYVTDKGTSMRQRGTTLWPHPATTADKRTLKVARIKHSGIFNPEPKAHDRLALLMHNDTATKLELLEYAETTSLAASGAKVALLTGRGQLKMPADQTQAIKSWIDAGGMLVVDAAGGDTAFARSAEELIEGMFGRRSLQMLSSVSPIYRQEGFNIERVLYRRQTAAKLRSEDRRVPNLRTVVINERPAVIFSPQDLTAALVGYPSMEADGYDPTSAYPIMRNIMLYAAGATAQAPAASAPASTPAEKQP